MQQHPLLRPLHEEYERQVKLLAEYDVRYVENLQAFARDHPELKHVAQRLLSQHMGWV